MKLTVASPCPMDWDAMDGNERARHCRRCNLDVYDLEGMSDSEIGALFKRNNGRLCGRVRVRRRAWVWVRAAGALVSAAVVVVAWFSGRKALGPAAPAPDKYLAEYEPFKTIAARFPDLVPTPAPTPSPVKVKIWPIPQHRLGIMVRKD